MFTSYCTLSNLLFGNQNRYSAVLQNPFFLLRNIIPLIQLLARRSPHAIHVMTCLRILIDKAVVIFQSAHYPIIIRFRNALLQEVFFGHVKNKVIIPNRICKCNKYVRITVSANCCCSNVRKLSGIRQTFSNRVSEPLSDFFV